MDLQINETFSPCTKKREKGETDMANRQTWHVLYWIMIGGLLGLGLLSFDIVFLAVPCLIAGLGAFGIMHWGDKSPLGGSSRLRYSSGAYPPQRHHQGISSLSSTRTYPPSKRSSWHKCLVWCSSHRLLYLIRMLCNRCACRWSLAHPTQAHSSLSRPLTR